MFSNKYPIFNRGRLLKLEMLEDLRDFPRDLLAIYYKDYGDGIVIGCELSSSEEYILIQPGIISYKGVLYILRHPIQVPYTSTEKTEVLKLKFRGEDKTDDFITLTTEIILDEKTSLDEGELELCRFKLKQGAKLRRDYINFADMETEYDTINIIHASYAAQGESTLSPFILSYFANAAFKYTLQNPLDINFCMMCLMDNKALRRELLLTYISTRLHIDTTGYSNYKLYRALAQILREIQHGKQNNEGRNYFNKKILID